MPGVWAGVCLVTAIADSTQCARGALGVDDHGGTGLLHRACLAVCVDALEPTGISSALSFFCCVSPVDGARCVLLPFSSS